MQSFLGNFAGTRDEGPGERQRQKLRGGGWGIPGPNTRDLGHPAVVMELAKGKGKSKGKGKGKNKSRSFDSPPPS
jgi:hypothetical protein